MNHAAWAAFAAALDRRGRADPHRCDSYKDVTDTGLADLLRRNVLDLAEMLKEARERKMSVLILARSYKQQIQQYWHHAHEFTERDSPVVASITRTKSETF